MLYLIGLGLNDEKDLSLRALEIAKKSECFIELYTSIWESLEKLEKLVGKEIIKLERNGMEEDSQKLLDLAKEKDVVIFIPGDPLAATTHIELLIQAKKQKIDYEIVHNASIFNAIGETGLQLYKFGRTLTIPFEEKIYAQSGTVAPISSLESVKEGIENNKKIGLHTLLLLDIGMNIEDAVKRLTEYAQGGITAPILRKDEKIITAHFGKENQINYTEAAQAKDLILPAVIIIPGKLHFKEEEFLDLI